MNLLESYQSYLNEQDSLDDFLAGLCAASNMDDEQQDELMDLVYSTGTTVDELIDMLKDNPEEFVHTGETIDEDIEDIEFLCLEDDIVEINIVNEVSLTQLKTEVGRRARSLRDALKKKLPAMFRPKKKGSFEDKKASANRMTRMKYKPELRRWIYKNNPGSITKAMATIYKKAREKAKYKRGAVKAGMLRRMRKQQSVKKTWGISDVKAPDLRKSKEKRKKDINNKLTTIKRREAAK